MAAQRILVPTDFSSASQLAIQVAQSVAETHPDSSIVLLHVVEAVVPNIDEAMGILEPEALRTQLEAIAATRQTKVPVLPRVEYGSPEKIIEEIAEAEEIDLIVMGTHGKRNAWEMLVGTTTESVMRRAACPVLAVREARNHEAAVENTA